MDELALLDWKRRIFALYAEVRAADVPEAGWQRWCEVRSELCRTHPQSPRVGGEPAYFPYDPALRFEASVEQVEAATLELEGSGGSKTIGRFAVARFGGLELELYWLEAYGGGVFLPFRDGTSGKETYGAGRYLLDTVKDRRRRRRFARARLQLRVQPIVRLERSVGVPARTACEPARVAHRGRRAYAASRARRRYSRK